VKTSEGTLASKGTLRGADTQISTGALGTGAAAAVEVRPAETTGGQEGRVARQTAAAGMEVEQGLLLDGKTPVAAGTAATASVQAEVPKGIRDSAACAAASAGNLQLQLSACFARDWEGYGTAHQPDRQLHACSRFCACPIERGRASGPLPAK
jgi:hypothetical protein